MKSFSLKDGRRHRNIKKEKTKCLFSFFGITACLSLARENGLTSVAFCCVSTGVFRFPREKAARIAIGAVTDYLATHPDTRVVFNVFLDEDATVYQKLLGTIG